MVLALPFTELSALELGRGIDICVCLARSPGGRLTGDLDRRCSRDPPAEANVVDADGKPSARAVEDEGRDAPLSLELPEGPVGGDLTGRLPSRLPKNSPIPGGL